MRPRVWTDRVLIGESMKRLQAATHVIATGNLADLPGAAAVIVGGTAVVDATFMGQAGPTLKVIARPGIGVDRIDIPEATRRGILVVNTPDAPTESTAEHAVALLLALAKHVVLGDRKMREGYLLREQMPLGTEVRGQVLGIVGLGRVGRRVAEICGQGLKMQVIAYDPYVSKEQATSLGATLLSDLDTLLARADFVTLHTPLTRETYHLIGERELSLMKQGAYLINTSRGPVVDEGALVRALESGHLAGAALDVFDPEPPLPDNPLFHLPNVVVTPHIASYTDRAEEAMCAGAAEQVLQVLRGERPPFLVNPEAWPGRTAT